MKLENYLVKNGLTETAFAGLIDVTQPSVNRYCKGRIPEPDVMQRIMRVTKGAVRPDDFYDLPDASKRAAS